VTLFDLVFRDGKEPISAIFLKNRGSQRRFFHRDACHNQRLALTFSTVKRHIFERYLKDYPPATADGSDSGFFW
jgi:hypothetical protein